MSERKPKGTILVTGGTAGIGAAALRLIVESNMPGVVLGARAPQRVPRDVADAVAVLPLDLAQLSSVNSFCEEVAKSGAVSGLVLNAGVNARGLKQTEDGFDLTFQSNFLSHFLIIQRLWDKLTEDAHIVITSSGTHDPEEKTPPPPPRHADAKRLAHPDTDPELDRSRSRAAARAYTASKLCCTLLSLELARRRPKGLSVSFDPGLVPGTRLTREFPRWLVKLLLSIMSRTMLADRTSTLPGSATALAYFIAQSSLIGTNGDYVAMRGGYPVVVKPSKMARNQQLQRQLWEDSLEVLSGVL